MDKPRKSPPNFWMTLKTIVIATLPAALAHYFWHWGGFWTTVIWLVGALIAWSVISSNWEMTQAGREWAAWEGYLAEKAQYMAEMARQAEIANIREFVINEYCENVGDWNAPVPETYIALRMNQLEQQQITAEQHQEDAEQRTELAAIHYAQQAYNHSREMRALNNDRN